MSSRFHERLGMFRRHRCAKVSNHRVRLRGISRTCTKVSTYPFADRGMSMRLDSTTGGAAASKPERDHCA